MWVIQNIYDARYCTVQALPRALFLSRSNRSLIHIWSHLLINSISMHNIWVRLNAVIFFALTVLLALATMAAFRFDVMAMPSNEIFRLFTNIAFQHSAHIYTRINLL